MWSRVARDAAHKRGVSCSKANASNPRRLASSKNETQRPLSRKEQKTDEHRADKLRASPSICRSGPPKNVEEVKCKTRMNYLSTHSYQVSSSLSASESQSNRSNTPRLPTF